MIETHQVYEIMKKYTVADQMHHIIDLEKSNGSWFVDMVTGKRYLDCFGQFGSMALGYNHPSLLSQKDRLSDASLHKIANSDVYSKECASFLNTLFSIVVPDDFKYMFMIEGGDAALANSLKISFDWKARKSKFNDDTAQSMDIVHLQYAFHGRGGYSIGFLSDSLKTEFFPRFKWTRITNPKISNDLIQTEVLERQSLEQAENALKKGKVAAVLLEVMGGEGCNWELRGEYLRELRKLTLQYDALLIFDEIQTGIGGTAKMFAFQHYDVIPDLLVVGKKLQVCGVIATNRMDEVKDHCFKKSGRINSTWGGNYTDIVRADIILNIIKNEKLVENTAVVGKHLKEQLIELSNEFNFISGVRGLGTSLAFDLPTTEEREKVLERLRKDILILKCGDRGIRFRPALTFSKNEVDLVIEIIKNTIYSLY